MEISKAKEQAEDLIVKLRELVGTLRQLAPMSGREAQREQLKVIANSIQHLEQKKVSVPEELGRLKSKLENEIQEAEKHQVVLFFLKEQLSQVLEDIGAAARKETLNSIPQRQGQ